jgi:enoyl-CoA hydratase/carnithine racemase
VNRVLPPERLLAEAMETGARMARRAPESVKGLKRAVYEGAARSLEGGLAVERKWFMAGAGRDESLRAMQAFVDEVAESHGSPWSDGEAMRPWQQGTATEGRERD